jgi:hypothetical protein
VPGVTAAPRVVVRDALIVVAACAAVGGIVNAARPHGIPLRQKTEYQILVPCPEGSGEAPGLAANDPSIWEARTLLVDARPAADFQRWHGAARVVVFGDGADPDSGEQLARELAGGGIRNVFFVQGGAEPLRAAAAALPSQRGGR